MAISLERLQHVEPSPEARRLLWHVLSAGVVTRDEPERHEGFDKPGAFLFWISSGRGTLEVGGRSFQLRPGPRCWLLDLRQARDYLPAPGRRLVSTGVRFAGPGVEAWLDLLGAPAAFTVARPAEFAGIRRVQRRIRELVTRRPRAYEWQVHLLVTHILGLLLDRRGLLAEPPKSVPASVARVLASVGAHPERPWRAHELARVAGISGSGLRTKFKQAQGETLRGFLARVRLEQARLRLGDPRLTCKDVARQLDFSSEHEFSHFFRRGAGISPSQFRLMTRVRRD